MRNKKILFFISLVLSSIFLLLFLNHNRNNEIFFIKPNNEYLNLDGNSHALYHSYNSLNEIKKESDLIIIGQPVSIAETGLYGVVSNIKVISTLKGKKFDTIKIYQNGSVKNNVIEGDILEFGKNYLLFLIKAEDGRPDTFGVMGGTQGEFRIEPDGRLANRHSWIREEVEKWKASKNGKKESDILIEYSLSDESSEILEP